MIIRTQIKYFINKNKAVKSIKKQQLVEVRSMANPPAIVKLALESICLLLGESALDWKAIRSVLMRDNFVPTIVNFNTQTITYAILNIEYIIYMADTFFFLLTCLA